MKIITVTPLSRSVFKEELTYFTSSRIMVGSLIYVPVRAKTIPSIVTRVQDASDLKTQIKNAPFSIKKIENLKTRNVFTPQLIESASIAADYFATTTGNIIQALVPKIILDAYNEEKIKNIPASLKTIPEQRKLKNEHYVFQSNSDERMVVYKSFIRESFARKQSVFFCLPSAQRIGPSLRALEKGIGAYTYILHGKMSQKEILGQWNKIITNKHPVLIIATGGFLAIPRYDLATIIVDYENSSSYKTIARPFLDYRVFAEIYAKTAGLKLICGDVFLRVETLYREQQKEMIPFTSLKFRALSTAKQQIVDMKVKSEASKKTFIILSNELKKLISETQQQNEQLFILVSRKGQNPLTVCGDCGTIIKCDYCSAPTILHKKNKQNIFICHKCGQTKNAERLCEICKSWRLVPLGIGIQLAEQEIKKIFPKIKLFRLDSDEATTHKKALSIMKSFVSAPGSILLGTEMALSYLKKDIENIAVLSLDSLFALPDFRAQERIFNLLLRLSSIATKNFIIQTRNHDEKVFKYISEGNLIDFYRYEIKNRQKLGYPPFKKFIKITREGSKEKVIQDMKKLSAILTDYEAFSFPAFTQTIKNKYRIHMLIKLDATTKLDVKLLGILKALPPTYIVQVDPENLL
ncbi:primosomal protein N' [Patescibacteria group bacterium]|nr:primosomal protein N' [Patescibacteria group bacterium]MBU1956154.1 primosomal protein N' [Patescibacteria group bacterium]